MNKQELIERIECLKNIFGNKNEYIKIDAIIELISELDEPQKVKIPQVIAEYIEQKKDDDYHLLGAMIEIRSHKNKEIDEWFEEDDNMEIFARAWLDGYEVEKELKYTVRMKGIIGYTTHLNKNLDNQNWFFASKNEVNGYSVKHTRKELEEAGFGWVFDCPGIEIEEVEKELNNDQ